MPTFPPPTIYQTVTTPTKGPSAADVPFAPQNIPVGPTADQGATPPAPEAEITPITPTSLTTGWQSWSTAKKAVVVGGGVLGLAAAIGIIKAIVR